MDYATVARRFCNVPPSPMKSTSSSSDHHPAPDGSAVHDEQKAGPSGITKVVKERIIKDENVAADGYGTSGGWKLVGSPIHSKRAIRAPVKFGSHVSELDEFLSDSDAECDIIKRYLEEGSDISDPEYVLPEMKAQEDTPKMERQPKTKKHLPKTEPISTQEPSESHIIPSTSKRVGKNNRKSRAKPLDFTWVGSRDQVVDGQTDLIIEYEEIVTESLPKNRYIGCVENGQRFCEEASNALLPFTAFSYCLLAEQLLFMAFGNVSGPKFKSGDSLRSKQQIAEDLAAVMNKKEVKPGVYELKCLLCGTKNRNMKRHMESHGFHPAISSSVASNNNRITQMLSKSYFKKTELTSFLKNGSFSGTLTMIRQHISNAEKATGRKIDQNIQDLIKAKLEDGGIFLGTNQTVPSNFQQIFSRAISASATATEGRFGVLAPSTIRDTAEEIAQNEPPPQQDNQSKTTMMAAHCSCGSRISTYNIKKHVDTVKSHSKLSVSEKLELRKKLERSIKKIIIKEPLKRGQPINSIYIADVPQDFTLDTTETHSISAENFIIPKRAGGITEKIHNITVLDSFTQGYPKFKAFIDSFFRHQQSIKGTTSRTAKKRTKTISTILSAFIINSEEKTDLDANEIYKNIYGILQEFLKLAITSLSPSTAKTMIATVKHLKRFLTKLNHTSNLKIENYNENHIVSAVELYQEEIDSNVIWHSKHEPSAEKKERQLIPPSKISSFLSSQYITTIFDGVLNHTGSNFDVPPFEINFSNAVILRNAIITVACCDIARRAKELTTVNMGNFRHPKVISNEYVLLKAPIHKTWRSKSCFLRFDQKVFAVLCIYVTHFRPLIMADDENERPLFPSTKIRLNLEMGEEERSLDVSSVGQITNKVFKASGGVHPFPFSTRRIRHAVATAAQTHVSQFNLPQTTMEDLAYVMGHDPKTQARYYTVKVVKERFESARQIIKESLKLEGFDTVDVPSILDSLTIALNGIPPEVPEDDTCVTDEDNLDGEEPDFTDTDTDDEDEDNLTEALDLRKEDKDKHRSQQPNRDCITYPKVNKSAPDTLHVKREQIDFIAITSPQEIQPDFVKEICISSTPLPTDNSSLAYESCSDVSYNLLIGSPKGSSASTIDTSIEEVSISDSLVYGTASMPPPLVLHCKETNKHQEVMKLKKFLLKQLKVNKDYKLTPDELLNISEKINLRQLGGVSELKRISSEIVKRALSKRAI